MANTSSSNSQPKQRPIWADILVQIVVTGGVVVLSQTFIQNYFAKEKLKNENFINSKKEAYFNAIEIAYREMAFTHYRDARNGKVISDSARLRERITRPNEVELNLAYGKLFLFSDNKEIPKNFYSIALKKGIDIDYLKRMMDAMRVELGDKDDIFANDTLLHIVNLPVNNIPN